MNKLVLATLITSISAAPFAAFAADAVKATTDATVKVDSPATPTPAPTGVAAPAEIVKDKVVAKTAAAHELKDGTKIEITGDKVEVIGKDGKKTAAPDGDHVLKDGSTIHVKGGMIVKK